MKVKAINLYTYKEPFKSPISTPKVKLTHRESLFTEIVTYSGEIYYGECNAFLTIGMIKKQYSQSQID